MLGELYAGAYKHPASAKILKLIDELLDELDVLNAECAQEFGRLRGDSLRLGTPFSTVDVMIAAVAIVHDLTLITNNTGDFMAIPGLRIDDC